MVNGFGGLESRRYIRAGRGLKLWLDQPMPHLSMKDYVELVDRWTSFRIDMTEFFESYDFIICPVMSSVAELHDENRRILTFITRSRITSRVGQPSLFVQEPLKTASRSECRSSPSPGVRTLHLP